MTATREQRQALAKYVEKLKLDMWLGHWRVDLCFDDGNDDDAYASILPTYGQKDADLRVCADFFELPPWRQRRTLVHELLHLHMADVQHLGAALKTNLGTQAYTAWFHGFKLALEHSVDQLTTLIAGEDTTFLPLPRFPKDRKHETKPLGRKE